LQESVYALFSIDILAANKSACNSGDFYISYIRVPFAVVEGVMGVSREICAKERRVWNGAGRGRASPCGRRDREGSTVPLVHQ
jgi:hypothetical protein